MISRVCACSIFIVACMVCVLVLKTRDARVDAVDAFMYKSAPIPNASLVLIRGLKSNPQDVVIRGFTGSATTHVGIVCRDATGAPFMLHTSRASGAVRVPLHAWLKRTRHTVLIRAPRFRVTSVEMESAVAPLVGAKYSYRMWKAVLRKYVNMELPSPVESSTGVFCSELVAEVLVNLGVLDFSRSHLTPSLILPSHFATLSLPFRHPNSYSDAYRLTL